MVESNEIASASLAEVVRFAMRMSFAFGIGNPHSGMSVKEVEERVAQVFEEFGIDRRVSEVGTVLADHEGTKGGDFSAGLLEGYTHSPRQVGLEGY